MWASLWPVFTSPTSPTGRSTSARISEVGDDLFDDHVQSGLQDLPKKESQKQFYIPQLGHFETTHILKLKSGFCCKLVNYSNMYELLSKVSQFNLKIICCSDKTSLINYHTGSLLLIAK